MNAASEPYVRFLDVPRIERPEKVATPLEMSILDKVNRKIAGSNSLGSIINFLFDQVKPICACDRLGLALVEEDGNRARAYHAVAHYEPLLLDKGYAQDLNNSSLKQVLERDQLRIINDLDQYLAHHPDSHSTHLILQEGIRSSLTCPLSIDGHNVGLLFRSSLRPNAFAERHAVLHQAIAERLCQAVVQTYRIEQLQAANDAYMELLGFVSHELKSPVASLVTDAEILKTGYFGTLNEKQRTRINRIISKGEYLLGIVREYIDLARIEDGDLQPNFQVVTDIYETVLEPAVEIIKPRIEKEEMRFHTRLPEKPVAAEVDANLLKIVMVNLLSNAVKYGRKGGAIELVMEKNINGLMVSIYNEGPGFPENQRSALFKKFSRLQTKELRKRKGTGVGLYNAWRIIQLHGGHMEAASEEGHWARFAFNIPQPLGIKWIPDEVSQQDDDMEVGDYWLVTRW
ncbi:GAF domain-containing sensor histidine kinase [bacterium]|nr:GAF domain-containing sensor histidine kinase [candidate division CSSED10-310 bacterium]